MNPILLVLSTERLQESADLLVVSFYLTIGLGMIIHKALPDVGRELCALVTYYLFQAKYLNTWLNKTSAISKAVGNLDSGIRQTDMENQSIFTIITVFPWDAGRSVMKSRTI